MELAVASRTASRVLVTGTARVTDGVVKGRVGAPVVTAKAEVAPLTVNGVSFQRLAGQASNGDVARTSFTVDYSAKSAAEEQLDGRATYVLDLYAKDSSVAYDRVRLWVDKTTYQPIRADFYVVSGKLIKRALYGEYDDMSGRRMLTRIEIDDLLRPGNRTVMRYSHLQQKDNPEKIFNKDSLGKW